MFHESSYSLGMIKLYSNSTEKLKNYIKQHPESFLLKQSILNLLNYYKFSYLENES